MQSPQIILGGRYQVLEEIGRGGMGIVFRAQDRLLDRVVALKRVLFDGGNWTSDEDLRLILTQEFRLLASVWHPHVISVLDYGFDSERQPFYTMQLIETPRTLVEAAQGRESGFILDLFRQMLEALDYLHGRDITHYDLKPSNVLVGADDQVKLLDFGLVSKFAQYNLFSGTPAYMAPEVLRSTSASEPAGAAADLYAVGVMLHEIFAGSQPYISSSGSLDIRAVLNKPIDLDDLIRVTGSTPIALIIARLLAKEPEDRYPDAHSLLEALYLAFDSVPLTMPLTLGESYLRPPFVGRQKRLEQLTAALEAAVEGRGSAWLVGGESGVGKSRLLDELRVIALTRGVEVLVGQGEEQGGAPYQFWRMPLRQLVLKAPPNPADASALAFVIPEMELLIHRPVRPPQSDVSKRQRALIDAIRALFNAQKQPILLILEDLQWAVESLVPLQALLELCPRLPLLIVASYRSDESPDLPDRLTNMRAIQLERFGHDEIARLSAAMLGRADRAELVDLLMRQTEGNAFYLVEFMRFLAESGGIPQVLAGGLSQQSWMSEGIRALIQRRLDRLHASTGAALRSAAIIGREVDLEVMRALDLTLDVEGWLEACIRAGVFEVVGGTPRFSHDKIRETVLASLDSTQRPDFYRQAARAVEAVHGGDKAYALRLYNLWNESGDSAKIREYAQKGGRLAMLSDDYATARRLLEQARLLTPPDERDAHVDNLVWQARTAHRQADFQDALALLEAAEQINVENPAQLSDILLTRAMIRSEVGGYEDGLVDADTALDHVRQIGDRSREAHLLGVKLSLYARLGSLDAMIQTQDEADALLEFIDDDDIRNSIEAHRSLIFRAQGRYTEALDYMQNFLATHHDLSRFQQDSLLNNIAVSAWVLGRLDEAALAAEKSMRFSEEIGGRWGLANAINLLGYITTDQGDLPAAEAYFHRALPIAQNLQATSLALDILTGIGQLHLRRGDLEGAGEYLGLALSHPETNEDVRMTAEPILAALREKADGLIVETALARGAALDLDAVVRDILDS